MKDRKLGKMIVAGCSCLFAYILFQSEETNFLRSSLLYHHLQDVMPRVRVRPGCSEEHA